jgi:hypothetical protein
LDCRLCRELLNAADNSGSSDVIPLIFQQHEEATAAAMFLQSFAKTSSKMIPYDFNKTIWRVGQESREVTR